MLGVTGENSMAKKYAILKAEFRIVMHNIFYNTTKRGWFDYHVRRKAHNLEFYPSVAVPLFAGCYMPLNVAKAYHLFKLINVSVISLHQM